MENGNDLVAELVGEGKKFTSVTDLAKGKIEADRFIEDLKTENKALREILSKGEAPTDADALRQKIDLMLSKLNGGSVNPPSKPDNQPQPRGDVVTKDEVPKLLSQWEMEKQQQANASAFNEKVSKTFGEKTNEVLNQRLKDLSMDKDLFDAIVSRNPQAALKLIGLSESEGGSGTTTSDRGGSVNTEAFFANSTNSGVKNWAYFQKLRRELGEAYYKPDLQQQVMKARQELGDAFWR